MADASKKENDNTTPVDVRLVPIAAAVEGGQVIERHWKIFRATYFPGMSDEVAKATLLAWAGRNNIKASLQTSYDEKSGLLEVTHVRFTKSS